MILRLCLLAAAVTACDVRPREDVRWVEYPVPGLAGPECTDQLLRVLSTVDGVLDVQVDLAGRRVSVQYNSRLLARKNIEHAIAAGGFDAGETAGDATAKAGLPPPCR